MKNDLEVSVVSFTLAGRLASAWRVLRGKEQLSFYSPKGLRVEAPAGEYPGAMAAVVIYPAD